MAKQAKGTPVTTNGTSDQDALFSELSASAEQAENAAKTAKTRAPRAAKTEAPSVDRVAAEHASQTTKPAMWPYAHTANLIKRRLDAGQDREEAINAVLELQREHALGILAHQAANGGTINESTIPYFTNVGSGVRANVGRPRGSASASAKSAPAESGSEQSQEVTVE